MTWNAEIVSLQRQLEIAKDNLRLIEERLSEFVLETDVPLQLIKSRRRSESQIEELEQRLLQLGALPAPEVLQHNLPPRLLPYYGYSSELEEALTALRGRYYLLSIEGIGGSGKTAFAVEVAYQCLELGIFEKAIWCSRGSEVSGLPRAIDSIIQVLGIDLDTSPNVEQKSARVLQALEEERVLLLLDDADAWADIESVRQFLIEIPAPNKALITSRSHQPIAQRVITLGSLPFPDALRLTRFEASRRGLDTIANASDSALRPVIEATGGLPLAILWVLGQSARVGLPRVMQHLQEARGEVFSLIFAMAWERLSPSAQETLRWLPLLGGSFTKNEVAALTDFEGDALDTSLNDLVEGTFIQVYSSRPDLMPQYRVHTLTTAFASRELASRLDIETSSIRHNFSLIRGHLSVWQNARRAVASKGAETILETCKKIAQQINRAFSGPSETISLVQLRRWIIASLDTFSAFQDTRLPCVLPLIFATDTQIDSDDYADLAHALLHAFGESVQVGLLVVFAGWAVSQQFGSEIHRRMKTGYACDVIPIGQEDYLSLVIGRRPGRTLRKLVLAAVDLNAISPFTITGPTPDNVFFGREQELRELTEQCGDTSYAIVGGRRIGKSSLLGRLHRIRLPSAGFRALYYDCSTTLTYDAFLAAVIRDWRPEPPPNAPATFGDLFQFQLADEPLVLLLDEADKLVPVDRVDGWRLFKALRMLVNSGRAQVILSGERTLRDALRDPTSPLFNFANEMLLGPLNFHAVEELITRPMKQLEIELVDEKAIVDRIWAFTSGHPNVVQRLCRRLIERLNEQGIRRITLDDVNAVIEDPAFQRDDFLSTYWEAATSLEKIISLLMADDESVRTLRTVRQALAERCNLHPKAREVDDALQRLVDLRSILKRTPTGYEFAVEAFPRVVAGTMTLEDMLEVLVEDYVEEQAKGEA